MPAAPPDPPANLPAPPVIVMVGPQLGENIGTAARAMANFGLKDLRLVRPREGWPNAQARAAASRADEVIDAAQVFDDLPSAIADLGFVLATTARDREMSKPVRGPDAAARTMVRLAGEGVRVGILFGRERSGLTNDELTLADELVTFPVDPDFASLNVAQAVLLVAYEWRRNAAGAGGPAAEPLPFAVRESKPARREDLIRMFEHLESALDAAGFFRPPEKRPHFVSSLRAIFHRAQLSDQEVRTLRGVIAALERRPTRPYRAPDGGLTTERGRR